MPSEAIPSDSSSDNLLTAMVTKIAGEKMSKRMEHAVLTYALGKALWDIGKKMHREARDKVTYTVTVPSADDAYEALVEHLSLKIPESKKRSITVQTRHDRGISKLASSYDREDDCVPCSDSSAPVMQDRYRAVAFYDGKAEQKMVIEGHKVLVSIEEDTDWHVGSEGRQVFRKPTKIVFVTYSAEGKDAVLQHIHKIVDSYNVETDVRPPRSYIAGRWGGWDRQDDLEARTLDTVVLPEGQKERLIEDMSDFLSLRDVYMRYGIPYHRGYLFEGPPGTGKTSLAKGLATHFGLDIYYCPLGDIAEDTNLIQLIANVKAGSIVLFEDIDVLHVAQDREGNDDDSPGRSVSLSGLLNALDGVHTPSGLITIMTTNRVEVLDEALIRTGRADMKEHIGYLNDQQLQEIRRLFFGEFRGRVQVPSIEGQRITAGDVIGCIKQHLKDLEQAWVALMEFLHEVGTSKVA
jgi:hypothetical protein